MKRLFWVTVGAVLGVLVVRKLAARASRFTPSGVVGQVTRAASGLTGSIRDSLRSFGEEVRAGMTERESELREATLLGDHRSNGHSGLDADTAARLTSDPDAKWRTED